ncbi:hypothetical protein IHE45_03G044400 [Dioscorea alata]|uniref:Uncharacterized protein n=1 Tax=Dioscorea alata TaxID=55571 RepID=A0ACB7WJZ2_DIOAL|nr:hypothetical protein IHE45_03G044400 [Dioscorea alata]
MASSLKFLWLRIRFFISERRAMDQILNKVAPTGSTRRPTRRSPPSAMTSTQSHVHTGEARTRSNRDNKERRSNVGAKEMKRLQQESTSAKNVLSMRETIDKAKRRLQIK